MDSKQLYKFVEEIRQQCRFAQIAIQNMRNEILAMKSEKTFFFVHALLAHANNIALLFWPVREGSKDRGETLRKELKPSEELSRQLKEIRPHLEHYDERYEDWLATLDEWSYVDMNIMPQGTMAGYKQDAFQRNLDPENLKLELRGAPCDLKVLSDQIKKLEASSNTWLRSHNPW